MKKRLSIPLLLCAALLVYAILAPSPGLLKDPSPPQIAERVADSYAQEVTVNEFNEDGALRDRTEADMLRRYPEEALIEFDAPRRYHYAADGAWFASAEKGALQERREVLTLSHNVQLRYATEDLRFLSENIAINLDTQVAESRAPVRMWQAANETRADKMFINLNRQVATLNGSVQTRYVVDN